jgi:hypothetical protein
MKTTLLACTTLLLTFFFSAVKAQTDTVAVDTTQYQYFYTDLSAPADSSVYDLGRITVQRKFTQAITIKAADLEKMPVMDLKEALATYYNGIYGSTQKFSYIINGVLNNDVNAYSIFDIEEVTFVQSAFNALNGVLPSQVLVLVKTRRGGPGTFGVTVSGQTNAISKYVQEVPVTATNADNAGKASNALYHQYNVSFYSNSEIVTYGGSLGFQHNVFPQYRPDDYWGLKFKPYTSNRIKLSGYVDVNLDEYNTISFTGGFVPQSDAEARKRTVVIAGNDIQTGFDRTGKQNLLYGNLEYKSTILERITNKFSASYQRLGLKGRLLVDNSEPISDTLGTNTAYTIKDDISYQFGLGDDLIVTPQLNLTYRNATDTSSLNYYIVLTRIRGYRQTQQLFTVTPSITVSLKDIIQLQFGAQRAMIAKSTFGNNRTIINKATQGADGALFTEFTPLPSEFNNSTAKPILPFATVNFDLTKIAYTLRPKKKRPKVYKPNETLIAYASFARTTSYTGDLYGALADNINVRPDPVSPIYEAYDSGKAYNQIAGGLTYSLLKKGLSFSYNYGNSKFATVYYKQAVFGNPPNDSAKLVNTSVEIHRLGINFTTQGDHQFTWSTNLNAAFIMNTGPKVNYYTDQMRINSTQKGLLTGGFVNNFSFKDAYMGFNILYGFNKSLYTSQSIADTRYIDYTGNTQVINLQSAYLGYQIKFDGNTVKSLDLFVNGQNLWQRNFVGSASYRHYSANESRYFGGGFKLGL